MPPRARRARGRRRTAARPPPAPSHPGQHGSHFLGKCGLPEIVGSFCALGGLYPAQKLPRRRRCAGLRQASSRDGPAGGLGYRAGRLDPEELGRIRQTGQTPASRWVTSDRAFQLDEKTVARAIDGQAFVSAPAAQVGGAASARAAVGRLYAGQRPSCDSTRPKESVCTRRGRKRRPRRLDVDRPPTGAWASSAGRRVRSATPPCWPAGASSGGRCRHPRTARPYR